MFKNRWIVDIMFYSKEILEMGHLLVYLKD